MKIIPLTKGQVAIVDNEHYDWLNQWKWCANWNPHTRSYYVMRTVRLLTRRWIGVQMHRQILGLEYGDKRQGDHINHVTLDNRLANLRIVSQNQNQHNQRSPKGYSWYKAGNTYRAYIKVNGQQLHLGYFDVPTNAHAAYLAAKAV